MEDSIKVKVIYYTDESKTNSRIVYNGTQDDFLDENGNVIKLEVGDSFTFESLTGEETVRVYAKNEFRKTLDSLPEITYHIAPFGLNAHKFNS